MAAHQRYQNLCVHPKNIPFQKALHPVSQGSALQLKGVCFFQPEILQNPYLKSHDWYVR